MSFNKVFIIFSLFLVFSGCSVLKRSTVNDSAFPGNGCDSVKKYNTLYISRIDADLMLGEDEYDARLSLYYVPDSLLMVTAVNSGFEIIRAAINKDSIIYINRLDKFMLIIKDSDIRYNKPFEFRDIELLLNKKLLCEYPNRIPFDSHSYVIDRSDKDITRVINVDNNDLRINKFQFFHKKTAEFIVGELDTNGNYEIYSDYIIKGLLLKTSGGEVQYDKEINVNLSVNKSKYEVLYY